MLNKSTKVFSFKVILILLFVNFLTASLIILILRIKTSTINCLVKNWNALALIIFILGFDNEFCKKRDIERGDSEKSKITIKVNILGQVAISINF